MRKPPKENGHWQKPLTRPRGKSFIFTGHLVRERSKQKCPRAWVPGMRKADIAKSSGCVAALLSTRICSSPSLETLPLNSFYFMCTDILLAGMFVHHKCAWFSQKPEEGVEFLGTGVTGMSYSVPEPKLRVLWTSCQGS